MKIRQAKKVALNVNSSLLKYKTSTIWNAENRLAKWYGHRYVMCWFCMKSLKQCECEVQP